MELYPFYLLPVTYDEFHLWLLDTTRPFVGAPRRVPGGWVSLLREPELLYCDPVTSQFVLWGYAGTGRKPNWGVPQEFKAYLLVQEAGLGGTRVAPRHLLPPSPARTYFEGLVAAMGAHWPGSGYRPPAPVPPAAPAAPRPDPPPAVPLRRGRTASWSKAARKRVALAWLACRKQGGVSLEKFAEGRGTTARSLQRFVTQLEAGELDEEEPSAAEG